MLPLIPVGPAKVHPSPVDPRPADSSASLAELQKGVDFAARRSRTQSLLVPSVPTLLKVAAGIAEARPGAKTSQRVAQCSETAWIETECENGSYRLCSIRCSHRMCPRCGSLWQSRQRSRLKSYCQSVDQPMRLVTLTMRSTTAPLADQLSSLWNSFRRLRQQHLWKARIAGGIAVVEITINPDTGLWHPHIHALTWGDYIPQARLSKAWNKASRGSPIVDIRRVYSAQQAANYLTKYLTKSFASDCRSWSDPQLKDFILGLQGSHLLMAFGRRVTVTKATGRGADSPEWIAVCHLASLLDEFILRDPWAKAVVAKLRWSLPCFRRPADIPDLKPRRVVPDDL